MIITLGGRAGTGTSSAGHALAKKLGYKFFSAGDIRRKLATDKGITLAELNEQAEKESSSDFLVDDQMKKMAESDEDMVVDAMLGFYFFPESIKILFEADIHVRAKRIVERASFEEHPGDIKEAVKLIKQRDSTDEKRFEKLYGVRPYDHNHFDLIFDTSETTVAQAAESVYKFVMNKLEK